MHRCMVARASSTARWLTIATRNRSGNLPTSAAELRSSWKTPSRNLNHQHRSASSQPQGGPHWSPGSSDGPGIEVNLSNEVAQVYNTSAPDNTIPVDEPRSEPVNGDAPAEFKVRRIDPLSNTKELYRPSQGYRSIRPEGSKATGDAPRAPAKHRPLPISPLMDPFFLEARNKRHVPKLPASTTPTEFQKQLAKNPYAIALATPVRRCQLTGTSLPSYFLQDFKVLAEPETGDPWYVPVGLTNKHSPKESVATESEDGVAASEEGVKPPPSSIGFKAYTLNSKLVLSAMQDADSGYKQTRQGKAEHAQLRFIPQTIRGMKDAMKVYGKARWRQDMQDFVPELMRRRIMEGLIHACKLKRGYMVGCADWEAAMQKPQAAAFLWTGEEGSEEVVPPEEFATLDVGSQFHNQVGPQLGKKKRKVPVHNLRTLLGREKLSELRAKAGKTLFDKGIVVLKHKKATVELQMQLWRLQGYLAEHRAVFASHSEEQCDDQVDDQEDDDYEDTSLDEDFGENTQQQSLRGRR